MTEESKLAEFKSALDLLMRIDAPLKLVITGNHEISLDTPVLRRMLLDNTTSQDSDIIKETYGDFGEARAIFNTKAARASRLFLLDEGTHRFTLNNGASLLVFASPYTSSADAPWAYQYTPSQELQIISVKAQKFHHIFFSLCHL